MLKNSNNCSGKFYTRLVSKSFKRAIFSSGDLQNFSKATELIDTSNVFFLNTCMSRVHIHRISHNFKI